jgi:hypothetical protein
LQLASEAPETSFVKQAGKVAAELIESSQFRVGIERDERVVFGQESLAVERRFHERTGGRYGRDA